MHSSKYGSKLHVQRTSYHLALRQEAKMFHLTKTKKSFCLSILFIYLFFLMGEGGAGEQTIIKKKKEDKTERSAVMDRQHERR